MMGGDPTSTVKSPKITARVQYSALLDRPPSRNVSRPASPTKQYGTSYAPPEQPTFRPKAKVNSSATVRTNNLKATSNYSSESPTPRPASPAKLATRPRNVVTASTSTPKARSVVGLSPKVQSIAASAPVTPESRNRSYTTTKTLENVPPPDSRNRNPSVSLHHAASFSSLQAVSSPLAPPSRLTSSRSIVGLDRASSPSPSVRIRSKVTGIAKTTSASSDNASTVSQQQQPSYPSSRPNNITATPTLRNRAPSTSSNASGQQQPPSSPPMPQFYPITTASPAANPHRYNSPRPAVARTTAPTGQYVNAFQSMHQQAPVSSSPTSSATTNGLVASSPSSSPRHNEKPPRIAVGSLARVEPSSIPPPPLSPPVSALSFSSRSSASMSKSSTVSSSRHIRSNSSTEASPRTGSAVTSTMDLRSTLDNLLQYTSGLESADGNSYSQDEDDVDQADRKIKAEAKSNRKIEDLEISNRSLLAINASLEATKNRQAKEIRELRRKLRESRLLLPPRTYRRIKSSLTPDEIADDEDGLSSSSEEEEEKDEKEMIKDTSDEIYKRVKIIIDSLLKSGQEALESKSSDFGYSEGGTKGGAKVLSAEEVRDWHGSREGGLNRLSDISVDTLADVRGRGTRTDTSTSVLDGDLSFDLDTDADDKSEGETQYNGDSGYRQLEYEEQDEDYEYDEDEDPDSSAFDHPSRLLRPSDLSVGTVTSEDEVEAMTALTNGNAQVSRKAKNGSLKSPPPIFITQPT